ncbi:MAG: phosphoribosylaminoimidazolesuccinocarboxamide synthase [Lachnospiraceae bacterium]|nr:phosphoribosylaminoimidazolesuccinocarboxamide synthase [Lachnospiraceae bacterium]
MEKNGKEVMYEGKSKVIYAGPDEKSVVIFYKDTATAFNGEKKEDLNDKGKLNAAISNLLYDYLSQNGIETHLIEVIDETKVLAKKAEIVMVEVIVRNVAAGSFSKKYGVAEGSKLNNIVAEFSLKDDELGDPMINISQITALGIATKEELKEMEEKTLRINDLLSELFRKVGIKLVDFKLEFGRFDGKLILCDEISPDSCRLWDLETNEKLDKDRFRRNMGNVPESYQEVLTRLLNV